MLGILSLAYLLVALTAAQNATDSTNVSLGSLTLRFQVPTTPLNTSFPGDDPHVRRGFNYSCPFDDEEPRYQSGFGVRFEELPTTKVCFPLTELASNVNPETDNNTALVNGFNITFISSWPSVWSFDPEATDYTVLSYSQFPPMVSIGNSTRLAPSPMRFAAYATEDCTPGEESQTWDCMSRDPTCGELEWNVGSISIEPRGITTDEDMGMCGSADRQWWVENASIRSGAGGWLAMLVVVAVAFVQL